MVSGSFGGAELHFHAQVRKHRFQRAQRQHHVLHLAGVTHDAETPDLAGEIAQAGADPKSAVFYNRVKGEVEQAIAAIGLPAAYYFRPSLLTGPRAEHRPWEKIGIAVGKLIAPLLIGALRKYRPIHADTVAAAMVYVADHDVAAGVIESDAIARFEALGS